MTGLVFPGSRFVGDADGLFGGLRFGFDEGLMRAEWIFSKDFGGPPGIVHGGALASVIDEAMTALIFHLFGMGFTAELNVRYIAPVPIDQKVIISSGLEDHKGRKVRLKGKICLEDGTVTNEAEALFILMTGQ